MATHYKGQRITELLEDIARIEQVLDDNTLASDPQDIHLIAQGYATLAITKAKLTALMGDDDDNQGKKSR